MSHDQRPARMRIVNQARVPGDAGRRRDDTALAVPSKGGAVAAPNAVGGARSAGKTGGGISLTAVLLFLIGCAVGGAGIAYMLGTAG